MLTWEEIFRPNFSTIVQFVNEKFNKYNTINNANNSLIIKIN